MGYFSHPFCYVWILIWQTYNSCIGWIHFFVPKLSLQISPLHKYTCAINTNMFFKFTTRFYKFLSNQKLKYVKEFYIHYFILSYCSTLAGKFPEADGTNWKSSSVICWNGSHDWKGYPRKYPADLFQHSPDLCPHGTLTNAIWLQWHLFC